EISGWPTVRQRGLPNLRLQRPNRVGRLVCRLAGLQTHHDAQPPVIALFEASLRPDRGQHAHGNDHVEAVAHVGSEESPRHDTDHGERHAFEREALSYHVARAAEAALPEWVANHGDRTIGAAAADIVCLCERASDDWTDAEGIEEARRRPRALATLPASAIPQSSSPR